VRIMSEKINLENKATVYERKTWVSGSYHKHYVFMINLTTGQSTPIWQILKAQWIDDKNRQYKAAYVDNGDLMKVKDHLLKAVDILFSSKSGQKKVFVKYYVVANGGIMQEIKSEKINENGEWYDVVKIDNMKVYIGKNKIKQESFTT